MSVEYLEDEKFEFMAEDNDGNLTEKKQGSCRKMSMKAQRRVNEWLTDKFDKKTEIMGDLLNKADQPVLDDQGNHKKDDKGELQYQALWATFSQGEKFEIYDRVIRAQNPQLTEDDVYSLSFKEADEIVLKIFGFDEVIEIAKNVRDASFLSTSEKANTETGIVENAESSDSAKKETVEA